MPVLLYIFGLCAANTIQVPEVNQEYTLYSSAYIFKIVQYKT
jgi:hypothetical protein